MREDIYKGYFKPDVLICVLCKWKKTILITDEKTHLPGLWEFEHECKRRQEQRLLLKGRDYGKY